MATSLEQDPHPILSDLAVRQAIAHALDYDAIISKVLPRPGLSDRLQRTARPSNGPTTLHSSPMPSTPIRHHRFLEDAGWTDSDGDGVREC